MDYKEKYNAALERMKSWVKGEHPECFCEAQKAAEFIFPELKESEDEKIRKWLIEYFQQYRIDGMEVVYPNSLKVDDILAWLEKQSEKTPVWSEEDEKFFNDTVGFFEEVKNAIDHSTWLKSLKQRILDVSMEEIPNCLEKQGEQMSNDKVEPKFNVGDWITDGYIHYKITEILDDRYIIESKYTKRNAILFEYENRYHLWTINDAKDGDLIYVSTEVKGIQAIFHKFENGIIYFHCNLCTDFTQGGYEPSGDVEFVMPLPKIHYQKFFQKMKEAGYEWDVKNKRLTKKNKKL